MPINFLPFQFFLTWHYILNGLILKTNLSISIMARRIASWTVCFISAFSFKISSFMCIWTSQQRDQYFKYPFQYILDFLNLQLILPTAVWLDEYFHLFFFFFNNVPGWPLEKVLWLLQHSVCFCEYPSCLLCVFPCVSE